MPWWGLRQRLAWPNLTLVTSIINDEEWRKKAHVKWWISLIYFVVELDAPKILKCVFTASKSLPRGPAEPSQESGRQGWRRNMGMFEGCVCNLGSSLLMCSPVGWASCMGDRSPVWGASGSLSKGSTDTGNHFSFSCWVLESICVRTNAAKKLEIPIASQALAKWNLLFDVTWKP